MPHLLIDGYNLLHVIEAEIDAITLERKRDELCELLQRYQRSRSPSLKQKDPKQDVEVTVVFDSSEPGLVGNRSSYGRIQLLFTHQGRTADEEIVNLCQRSPGAYLVVTSDREIQAQVQNYRCTSITSEEFEEKLSKVQRQEEPDPYLEDKEEDVILYPKVSTKKKGASRKLPKRERQKNRILRDL